MLESWKMTGVNWILFIRTFFGWIGALILGAILSAAMFSVGVVSRFSYVPAAVTSIAQSFFQAFVWLVVKKGKCPPQCLSHFDRQLLMLTLCPCVHAVRAFEDQHGLRPALPRRHAH